MLLLTWHGTILRVEQTQRRLTHAPLVPARAIAFDFSVDMPAAITAPHMLAGGMEVRPGSRAGTVHVRRGAAYLSVEVQAPFPAFAAPEAGDCETLLPLHPAEVASLRDLLAGAWRRGDTGESLSPGSVRLDGGFRLTLGDLELDLVAHRPAALEDGSLGFPLPGGALLLTPMAAEPRAPELHLRPATEEHELRPVSEVAALHAASGTVWAQPAPPERVILPMAARRADQDWFYREPAMARRRLCGLKQFESRVVHEAGMYVALAPELAGLVFAPDGVAHDSTALRALPAALPAPFLREADAVFVSTAALGEMPVLAGPHALLAGAGEALDVLARLSVLHEALPPGTTLLLPEPDGIDYPGLLEACGLDSIRYITPPASLCQVEHLYRADSCYIEHVPAVTLDGLRQRARGQLQATSGETCRIYIRPPALIRAPMIEAIVTQAGFTVVEAEDVEAGTRAALFARADFVIGAHGPGLINLLFCAPGTKIIELAPDCAYRQGFALLSSKLGLIHGVLPCATADGGFAGALTVDRDRLRALLRLMQNRL